MTTPQLEKAYELGFLEAARWASRDDLRHDITSPAYLTQRDHDLAALATQAQGQDAAPAERTPKDYAIEHAEYMAAGAEDLIGHMNAEADARGAWESAEDDDEKDLRSQNLDEAVEATSHSMSSLEGFIYEFRKRAARAKE